MSQSIPSVIIPLPLAIQGHLTKNHARGPWICPHIKIVHGEGEAGFDKGWEVAKIQNEGRISIQNPFFSFIQSMKQNVLSVLRTVRYAVMFCN